MYLTAYKVVINYISTLDHCNFTSNHFVVKVHQNVGKKFLYFQPSFVINIRSAASLSVLNNLDCLIQSIDDDQSVSYFPSFRDLSFFFKIHSLDFFNGFRNLSFLLERLHIYRYERLMLKFLLEPLF